MIFQSTNINGFSINDSPANISTSDFITLPYDPNWSYCIKDMSSVIPTSSVMLIANNTGNSHIGVLDSYGSKTWGDYVVTFHVETQGGCSDEVSHWVIIEDDLEFPNVITPNGDGLNDVFAIKNLNTNINPEDPDEYRSNMLTIYDRWGKLVYQVNNYDTYMKDEQLFTGLKYFDGKNLSDGVYYFTFYYKGKVKITNYHGTITIIRQNQ